MLSASRETGTQTSVVWARVPVRVGHDGEVGVVAGAPEPVALVGGRGPLGARRRRGRPAISRTDSDLLGDRLRPAVELEEQRVGLGLATARRGR